MTKEPTNVRKGYLVCEVCEEMVERTSNVQKYCDKCRTYANCKKMSQYYRKHRQHILKQRKTYRQVNREQINARQRLARLELHESK